MLGKQWQSWIMDSVPWIPDSKYWILVFISGTNISGIPDSLSFILDSKAQESGFHKHKFHGFLYMGRLGPYSSTLSRLKKGSLMLGVKLFTSTYIAFKRNWVGGESQETYPLFFRGWLLMVANTTDCRWPHRHNQLHNCKSKYKTYKGMLLRIFYIWYERNVF